MVVAVALTAEIAMSTPIVVADSRSTRTYCDLEIVVH